MTGLRSLLASLVDYAGLFPPASLSMAKAVENYLRYRTSAHAWMLGRFVVPASRLDEFEACLEGQPPIPVSALAGANLASDVARIAQSRMRIDSIEIKAADAAQIDTAIDLLRPGLTPYFEIADLKLIPLLRRKNARAKIRTGGVTPEAFPSPDFVAQFLHACASTSTPFKATAGLHHPLRCYRPLTYAAAQPSGWMFGFLNVFLAALFARKGASVEQLADFLVLESPAGIHFEADAIVWQRHAVTEREIVAARRDFALSFGSCSFEEPVEDLRSLHLLAS